MRIRAWFDDESVDTYDSIEEAEEFLTESIGYGLRIDAIWEIDDQDNMVKQYWYNLDVRLFEETDCSL